MKKKLRNIFFKIRNYVSPHIHIYLICNDNIFLSTFQKLFSLNLPHSIIHYKNGEQFLEDSFIQKPGKKHISVIISDYHFEKQEHMFTLNGIEIFEIITHSSPETDYILLYNKEHEEAMMQIAKEHAVYPIKKNTNTHIRVQTHIHTLFNTKNIDLQKQFNTYLFINFGILILSVAILFLLA